MRKGQFILLIALVLGICMFFCARMLQQPHAGAAPPWEDQILLPELKWLRQRLGLDEPQFARVQELHLSYRPRCRELCQRISHAEESLMQVLSDPGKDATKALQEVASVRLECQKAMLDHIRQTAACMNPRQAKDYFNTVLPHFLGIRHCCELEPRPSK